MLDKGGEGSDGSWVVEDKGRRGSAGAPIPSYFCSIIFKQKIMPQISLFYGIIIMMYFSDHAPAHFHAWYGNYKVTVSIKDGVVKGEMPARALRMILEWLDLHRDELMVNWERACKGEALNKIEPLT